MREAEVFSFDHAFLLELTAPKPIIGVFALIWVSHHALDHFANTPIEAIKHQHITFLGVDKCVGSSDTNSG